MASSPRKSADVLNGILVMDHIPMETVTTLRLQHVCSPARQMRRNFPLLMPDIHAFVQTHCLLLMLFQILNAIIFVLENQELGENVAVIPGGMFMPSHPSVYIICLRLMVMVC